MRTLDRFISIERKTGTRDSFGQEIETWNAIDARRPAAYSPVSGSEQFTSQQFIGKELVEFLIRWSNDVADLTPLDRIVYPAGNSPPENEIYDIHAVHEFGRREALRIIASRRAE